MKTRHYLKRIKQKQNETQNLCSFVFHCSGLTSHQWRHLKNVFYIESNGSYQTGHKSGPLCFLSTQVYKQNHYLIKRVDLDEFDLLSNSISDLLTKSLKYSRPLEGAVGISLSWPCLSQTEKRNGGHQDPSLSLPVSITVATRPSSNTRHETEKVNLSRLFTKVNSLEGIHMILLYAKLESNLLNHADILASPGWSMPFGSSVESNAQAVLGLFFQSCFLDVQVLLHDLKTYSNKIQVKPKIGEEEV